MRFGRWTGLACLFLLASGVVGCGGGSLTTGAGAGTGSGGSGGSAGAGGGPAAVVYTFGGVTINIGSSQIPSGSLDLVITDQASPPALSTSLQFPAGTRWDPTDGAAAAAQYGCLGVQDLRQVQLVTCPNQATGDRAAAAPGCLVTVFKPDGVVGNFIHPSGASCDITAATGSIHLPFPYWAEPPGTPAQPAGAGGTIMLDCQGADGTHLNLESRFLLPVQSLETIC